LGNNNSGVYIRRAPGNSVVGNVVSGNNGFAGVAICGTAAFCGGGDAGTQGSNASGNVLKANLIGTNAAGTAALGNSGFGVSIDGAPNTIAGGATSGDINVIAANGSDGVHIFGDSPDGNLIRGNSIGTDAGGTLNLGNGGAGVILATGSNNTIGGTTLGTAQNIIAFNGGVGISLQAGAGAGNLLRFNQIDSNVGLGIDLGADGVTANDAGDGDTGPNNFQNFPAIGSVRSGGGVTKVDGTLQSIPNTEFVIDFFHSPTCDGTGFGEGRTRFGSLTQSTDANGNLSFSVSIGVGLSGGVVTALATSPDNSTSEFSACATVENAAGGALSFDGVEDLVTVPHSSSLSLQTLTVEAWMKIDDPNFQRAPLVSKGSDFGNYTLAVRGDAGLSPRNVEYVHQTASGNFSCCSVNPGPLSFGVWTHVAATFSGGVARVYVNGAFVATASGGPPPVENNAALTLGRAVFASVPSQFVKGLIDEVRVWNIVRSDAEIAQNYNKSISPATAGLVAYWKFDEGEGQTVTDSTAFGNNGTLGADAAVASDDPSRVVSTAPIQP
ncbi:MAG TPA: LamG domain-containing protein, partial [Thermoanaerobaculia bacterium]|nr:LamG domain-containing protein [Thermoanaerobaculia bacterium]